MHLSEGAVQMELCTHVDLPIYHDLPLYIPSHPILSHPIPMPSVILSLIFPGCWFSIHTSLSGKRGRADHRKKDGMEESDHDSSMMQGSALQPCDKNSCSDMFWPLHWQCKVFGIWRWQFWLWLLWTKKELRAGGQLMRLSISMYFFYRLKLVFDCLFALKTICLVLSNRLWAKGDRMEEPLCITVSAMDWQLQKGVWWLPDSWHAISFCRPLHNWRCVCRAQTTREPHL